MRYLTIPFLALTPLKEHVIKGTPGLFVFSSVTFIY
jgi:hypothetical protein